jgi:trimethylamine--corrinoid protein Co-methyltransferase
VTAKRQRFLHKNFTEIPQNGTVAVSSPYRVEEEAMVLANALIAMNRVFARGVRFDDEALALDVIHKVGPGSQFRSHNHTITYWRELWLPLEKGGKDMRTRVQEATVALLDSHQPAALPATVAAEIDYLLSRHPALT